MYPPTMELIVSTRKTSIGFTPPKSNAEMVNSVGIGIKLENIPLKKSPNNPYFMNIVSCNMELMNSLSIL